jgi:hypothetical protein
MTAKATTRTKTSLANRVLRLQDKARALYQQKDAAFDLLLANCTPGEIIHTAHGDFTLHDNFSERNVGFRPASFHRFELKEVKPAKQAKRPPAERPIIGGTRSVVSRSETPNPSETPVPLPAESDLAA